MTKNMQGLGFLEHGVQQLVATAQAVIAYTTVCSDGQLTKIF